jgi:hypothetical protein
MTVLGVKPEPVTVTGWSLTTQGACTAIDAACAVAGAATAPAEASATRMRVLNGTS